jgi:hypothetical protein
VRKFDLLVEFDHGDPRLRPGFTAHLTLVGEEVKNALYVPRVAIFEKDGKPIVYLKQHNDFVAQDVKLETQTSAWAVIKGLASGGEVALVNPVAQSQVKSGAPTGPPVQGAGR